MKKDLENLFYAACETGQLELVKKLIEEGVDIEAEILKYLKSIINKK